MSSHVIWLTLLLHAGGKRRLVAQVAGECRVLLGHGSLRDGGAQAGTIRALELPHLLVEVVVEAVALDDGGVGLLKLLPIEPDEDGLDVVDELVDPGQVEERSIDGLGGRGREDVCVSDGGQDR